MFVEWRQLLLVPAADTRWLSTPYALHLHHLTQLRLLPLALEMHERHKRFLLIMLWDTRVMRTHGYADKAANFMFWSLNLPRLFFFLWSHEQWMKYTVNTEVRYSRSLTGVKQHWSRFKNKLHAMSSLIYISQTLFSGADLSFNQTDWLTEWYEK